ncbi:uncharacterized protein LOC116613064 [Nematostella vectensis]|uniref:uncharacterized protein LOC116613064 n=1 Tax=Nematostella vectensis TaxID=45351 RepID=UPI00138FD96F|nr:uncharacterized protein LOC116613064 [Nematostella vectensis]XP_048590316.1 uncharacterized protein LOC116613064 [Nematostella vectensis]
MQRATAVLLYLACTAAVTSTVEGSCRDQYRTCPGWGASGYCDKPFYKSFMKLMCAYTCDTCDVIEEPKPRKDESLTTSALGEDDKTTNQEGAPVLSSQSEQSTSGEKQNSQSQVQGESTNDNEENERNDNGSQSGEEATEQEKAKSDDAGGSANEDIMTGAASSQPVAGRKEKPQLNVEALTDHTQSPAVPQDGDDTSASGSSQSAGARDIVLHEDYDDEVNPRSEISSPSQKTQAQTGAISPEEVSSLEDDDSTDGDAKPNSVTSGSGHAAHDEMKDIAGDVTSGSKIFETNIGEDITSGCSSGFGCSSGNDDTGRSEGGEGGLPIMSRSSIARPTSKVETVVAASGSGKESTGNDVNEKTAQTAPTNPVEVAATKSSSNYASGSSGSGSDATENTGNNDVKTSAPLENVVKIKVHSPTPGFGITKLKHSTAKLSYKTWNKSGKKVETEGAGIDGDDEFEDEATTYSIHSEQAPSGSGEVDKDRSEKQPVVSTVSTNAAASETVEDTKETKSKPLAKIDHKIEDKLSQKKTAKIVSTSGADDKQASSSSGSGEISEGNVYSLKGEHEIEDAVYEEGILLKPTMKVKASPQEEKNETGVKKVHKKTGKAAKASKKQAKMDKPSKKTKQGSVKTKPAIKVRPQKAKDEQGVKYESKKTYKVVVSKKPVKQDKPIANNVKNKGEPEIKVVPEKAKDEPGVKYENKKGRTAGRLEHAKVHTSENKQKDLSSPLARDRISEMEEMIMGAAVKASRLREEGGAAREEVPESEEEDHVEPAPSDLGKGVKVSLILNQDYHHEYSEEDSMAYEILAQNLKKEVEQVVGSDSVVSEIRFSKEKSKSKVPRVLAKFKLLGNGETLHKAVKGGFIENIAVDQKFFKIA